MINLEMHEAEVLTYSGDTDAYGQRRTEAPASIRSIQICTKTYIQTNVSDPRYVDAKIIGLTKDKDITTADRLRFGGHLYDVLDVIPSLRLNQVFLIKHG